MMNPKPVESRSCPTVGRWAWRSRSGLLTLLAGAAILMLSAALGYRDHSDPEGIHWMELVIYLCAAIVVSTQGLRLIRAMANTPGPSGQWLRSRFGNGSEPPSA